MPKKGYKQTEEHKRKISENSSKYWLNKNRSEETKRKISEKTKGNIPWNKDIPLSEEHKRKIGESQIGRKAWNKDLTKETDERVKRLSELKKGIPRSEETKRKVGDGNRGKIVSEKTKNIKREQAILQHLNTTGPYKNTKPELAMKKILNELNISFEHQFRLGNHLYDFHLSNTNILIEVDGDYWHSNPKIYSKLNKTQQKIKQRDLEKEKVVKDNGFILLRFWENDILNNATEIKEKLKECQK